MMSEATVTSEESAYRAKYYKSVTSVSKQEVFCSSCGNIISNHNYHAHPILEILQCQACSDVFRGLTSRVKGKAWKKRCLMCGSDQCQTLFPCPVKDCPYSFCKNCIKRNAASALLVADMKNWKCFVCRTNPLWEARGICVTLMSASSRRRKKLKTVREESSEDDDFDDIKTQMLSKKTSRVSRVSESKSSSNVRRRRPLRNSSKSGVNEIHEESDNDIEMVSVVKLAKSSQQRTTKTLNRKDSPERSSVERNTTPEPSGHQSKSAFPISRRKIRAGSTDSKKGTQKFTQHLEKFKRQNSDSSSGKEFTQKKIIRESYVTLQRLSTLEQDFTHSPDETDSPQGMVLSNQQIFSLKCSIQDFIHNLKSASKKMIEAADSLQRQYSQKETIRPAEATKWIVECKSTVASFKKKIDDNEHTLVNKFGSWCKKTKIKNIFISANGIDESVTPSRTDLHDRGKRRGIVPSSSDDDEKETTDDRKTSSMSKTPEVSDCESAEIFTQDEEAHSSKTKSKSRRQSRTDKILSPVDEEMNGDTSDAEHRESSLRSSSVVSDVIVEANSSKITGADAEKSSNDDMFADSEDERKSRKTERQGKTEKIRQQEELSDSANAQEEVFVPGPKCSKKSRKSIEKVGSITSREKSSDSLLLCEDENDEKNNDKKKNKRATLSVTDSEDDQKSKRKPRTKSLKSSEGKKKTESQENKENRGKPPSLMDSDTSADEAKRKKSKAVRNRSKGQSRISSDNEKISRSDNKKKKMKGSTPISSDVDASNDDGKLVQPVEEKSDTVEMTNEPSSHQPEYSSEQDLRMDLSDTPEKNEKPSAVGEDDNARSAAAPADANTVEANKSKDKSGNEGKKKKKKSQEKKPLSSGVSNGEMNTLGLSSDCSFVTIEEPSSPGDTSSKRNDPVAEAPDDTELAINTSPNSITSEIPTIALDQSESGEKDPDEAEKQAKANLLESSSDSEDEDEDEISELLVEKSKERLKESESKEDSGTEKPPEESEVDDKSKRKDSAKLATHDDVAMEVVNERAGSSNEDEVVALDKAEKSIEERPSDCERKAKEALLNSDSSSDDDQTEESPEKSSSTGVQIEETTKDSLLEPDTSSDKISDDTASKGQKKEALASSLPVNGPGTSNTKETDEISQKSGDEVEHSDKNSDGPKENEKSQSGSSIAGKPLDPKLSSESKKLGNNTMRDIMEEMEILSDQEDAEGDSKELKLPLKKPAHAKDEDSDSTASSTPRVKKRKLSIRNSEFYKNDKKLRMKCSVVVNRLSNSILRRHARALKKSKEYLEDKKFKSLTALDGLERSRKRQKGNTSDVSDTSIIRSKKKTLKEAEDTLVDHLNVNGEKINPDDSSSSDQDTENHEKSQPSGDLQYNAERLAKSTLMESSDDDKAAELSSDDESVKESTQKSDQSKEKPSTSASTSSKSSKADWKKSKLLTMKLSSSDEDEKSRKFDKKVQRLSQKDSDNSDFQDDTKKKKKVRRRRLNSDSDVKLTDEEPSNDSDGPIKSSKAEKKGKKRSKKTDNSSDSSESLKSKRPKPKRRRVRTAGTDSDSDAEDIPNSQGSPNKSGRKNIRRVIKDTKVADDTKQAAKQEEERLKRMAERQKLYNEMYEARLAGEEKVDKLILDFDEESKEILLSVNEGLVKRLKPHQAQGIKFMWDACFESLERAKSTSGSGCILAHCMGLGKSFQAVTLTHTVLVNSEKTGVRTVLVVCPLSTVLNWVNEFKIWLNEVNDGDDVEVYELTKFKQNNERRFQLERWQRTGGVIILGYEMYRNLSNPPKKVNKKVRESFFKCLVEPGPDLVICDEGHLLKSETTALSKAMSKIKTLRRIVLTGTPLQNNLTEYHCMVQFVKPNLLGTKKEFLNRFVNPIQNGQFDNSTEYDVKLMKKRAHVLHKMLEGSVQRFDYSVLTPFLPPKQEYVIFVELSDIQIKLYQYYIDNLARKHRGVGGSLFADFQALQRIWTHPIAIKLNADKAAEKKTRELSDSEGSLRDFIDDNSDEDSSDSISTIGSADSSKSKKSDVVVKRHTRGNPDEDEVVIEEPPQEQEWWTQFVQEEHFEDIRISAKLRILFEILKESENIGDKVLVFSQSLYSLTLIERFLAMIDDATHNNSDKPSELFDNHTGSWSLGLDYFRLDGQTTTENRSLWCKIFNRPTNTRARLFLISTRAGGLGINLTAANRVVIFDASWNPSHDVQSIFRIYRFGQKKPCYVYRLLAAGTMEEKIYNRQVTKLSLSCRVVDEQQIERHYTHSDLAELYTLDSPPERPEIIGCPKDRLLAEIFSKYKDIVINFHEHDSLLENKADEELDEEERKQAWLEYEQEKAGKPPAHQMMNMGFNYQDQMAQYNQQVVNTLANGNNMHMELLNLQKLYAKDFPNMSPEQQKMMATKALMDMYNYMETQAVLSSRVAPQLMGTPTPSYSNPTNTLANQLAQEAYTRHHQQAKQMTAYQKQLLYAQQFGNFKSIAGGLQITPQNSNMYGQQTAMAGMAAASSDGDVIEVIPNPTPSNSTAQSSSAQNKPSKYQEE